MLTAAEIGDLIKQCATHHVVKFQAGPKGEVTLTFSGYREPVAVAAGTLDQFLPQQGDPWLSQVIPAAPLLSEAE